MLGFMLPYGLAWLMRGAEASGGKGMAMVTSCRSDSMVHSYSMLT